jgi:hypothetical protein
MKITAENVLDTPLFARPAALPFQVLPSAHIVGVAAAAVAFVSERMGREMGRNYFNAAPKNIRIE